VERGIISVREAVSALQTLPYEDLGFAKLDHHRDLRKGFPEVILGQGKTAEQITILSEKLLMKNNRLLVTRATKDVFLEVQRAVPDAEYGEMSRTIVVDRRRNTRLKSGVLVVTAGTSDIAVAEEAVVTAQLMGNRVKRVYDVGVAGIHRLLAELPELSKARVIVAVAGMEGALPSVIGGLVSAPVIGVPTSNGYGASLGGLAALLAMLNSCAPGLSVVNIDNGFGAGYLAALINKHSGHKDT
jgi:NCAIR mutase (PurE)-related protein